MAAVLINGHSLHASDDYSKPVSQASSPASPSASFIIQQGHTSLPSINLSGPGYVDYHSQPPTPTSIRSDVALDPPPGMSFPEYLRTWSDDVVCEWLSTIKCSNQAAVFKANDIRGDVLLELDQLTLKEMGIHSVGDRIRIVAGVKKLRQRCSGHSANALASIINRPPSVDHSRHNSGGSDSITFPSPITRNGHPARRLESGRPAPLHITPGVGSDGLPRLIRDGQDSARANPPPTIRPLPQPNANPSTSHLPTRTGLPNIPPPPRGQPPVPNSRTPRSHLIPPSQLSGRRTPTLPEPPAFNTNQPLPLPPAPNANLLTPSGSTHESRQAPNGARPLRSQSPLSQVPSRSVTRSPHEHARNGSLSNGSSGAIVGLPAKPSPRPTPSHPYGLQPAAAATQTSLSPIAEAFNNSQRGASGTHSPPTSVNGNGNGVTSANAAAYRVAGNGPFARPNTPSHTPSLDDIRRKVVKFSMPDEGKSSMIQVSDCVGGADVLERALKKLRGVDEGSTSRVEIGDGGITVDGWAVFLDESQRVPLTEAQLLNICHAPPDEPAREHGLTLRNIKRSKPSPTSPGFTAFPKASGSTETLDETLLSPEEKASPMPGTKAYKRASSVSILSGLGVQIPDLAPSSSSSSALLAPQESPSKSPSKKGKLRNFFGQRPPSELITTHLAEFFPFTEKKVLERTRRQSMMRNSGMGVAGRRDSIISWNPPRSESRFSVSTQGSVSRASPRNSIMSGFSYTAPSPPSEEVPEMPPPRVSISTDDGRSIEADEAAKRDAKRASRPHLLPPVAFPSESLSDSLNLTNSRPGSRMSTASKRMSYITELRSKRDRSDTASMITVDEITAEVESRRESLDMKDDGDTDGWTAVESSEADTKSIKEVPEDELEGDSDEDVDDGATDVTVTDDEEPGKAVVSCGEKTIKWIKGALIGAGSFGKVYLGMDASTGLLMAVKQVELPTGSAPNEDRKKSMLSALEREIELLKDLHHENIVQYHSSSMEDDHLNIFLEYVPGGSVTSLLRNYGAFEEPLVRNWVRQILLGLSYLHERDIIHRDIKGANMLVDNKGGIKISDFGISKKIDDNLMAPGHRAHRPSLQGSVFWMAPEVVKQTAYTQKADIWSIGCLVVEMLTGEHPYPQLSQMQAIFKIGMSSKPTIPADISAEAESFLNSTFELDHEARPSAAQLLKHPWIANQPPPLGA